MTDVPKVFIGAAAAVGGFAAVATVNPFNGEPFDYSTASLDQKQKFLEAKAKNFSRGFNLTKGGASEISNVYVDAQSDLVSITVQLKDQNLQYVPAQEAEGFRKTILKSACALTDRKLLTETDYTLKIRFFRPGGGNFLTVEANGENCSADGA